MDRGMRGRDQVREHFKRARAGDAEAFWRLVEPYRGLVYSVALGMLKDPERAEDQLHDVLLTAHQSLGNLRDPSKLASWLHSMTRNRVMELMRRDQRLRGALQQSGGTMTAVVPVSELLEKESWMRRMEDAFTHLPEPFRVILAMKYTNDYSCQQIAEVLDISVSAVKSRLFEARKLLRKMTEALEKKEGREEHGAR